MSIRLNQSGDVTNEARDSLGDGIRVSRYGFDDRYDSLFEAIRIPLIYDTNNNPRLGGTNFLPKSSPSSFALEGPLNRVEMTKERIRMNPWLLDILKSSFTTKIIMFHKMKKLGDNSSDVYTWL